MSVYLKIDICADCPFVDVQRVYTADSFESAYNYRCKKKGDKLIEGDSGVFDPEPVPPEWCPLRESG